MSRRKTLPSLSSSRQMMIGLEGQRALAQARDHRLAAGLDALGDGDLALARQQLDRAHLAQIHAHRIVGALGRLLAFSVLATAFGVTSTSSPPSARPPRAPRGLAPRPRRRLLVLDHVDAHLVEHRQHVLDLLGGDLLGGQHGVELLVGDVAALLGLLDHLLDGGVGEVEQRQRAIGGLAASFSASHPLPGPPPWRRPLIATALIASTLLTGGLPLPA